jgi:di/tricarboxylate transporter
MSVQIIFLFIILGAGIVLFVSEKLRPDLVAIMVMLALGFARLITPDEVFSGFSSPSIILLLSVFILTGGLFHTGVSTVIGRRLMRFAGAGGFRITLVVMLMAGGLSLFMNNIASVAVIMPAVMEVSRRARISPSKLLMPMALAIHLAGMATLFTTSNIVASGVLQNAGLPGFGLLDFLPVGGSAAVAGILFIAVISRHSLPERRQMEEVENQYATSEELARMYRLSERMQAARILPGSRLIGRTLEQSGIGDRLGLTVIGIRRNGDVLLSPGSGERILRGDELLIEGRSERAAQLEAMGARLMPAAPREAFTPSKVELYEVMVAPHSTIIGKTLKDAQFRAKFGLNVVALWQGESFFRTDLGDVVLKGNEALLVNGPRERIRLLAADPDWIVLHLDIAESFRPEKMLTAVLIVAGTLAAAAVGLWPADAVLFLGALAVLIAGCLTLDEAYKAVDWRSVFLVAGMLPVGIALAGTGAAAMLGDGLIRVLGGMDPRIVVAMLFLITTLINQFLPGGAAVPAMLGPIAIVVAQNLGADPRAYVLVVAVATGLSILTPFAHPANAVIMAPGGYHFRDYLWIGLPVIFIVFLAVMLTLPLFWNIG